MLSPLRMHGTPSAEPLNDLSKLASFREGTEFYLLGSLMWLQHPVRRVTRGGCPEQDSERMWAAQCGPEPGPCDAEPHLPIQLPLVTF